ncbi:hypothetical protein [Herbiconiux daphne]|uniref:DUF58 domain-containing protein n=1 Tax=Herbiconiux daphne TaxID=2970914 RepID=A0ABT2H555_9MICO|nr:hypothetical protein [Herbiconiux daphne]MCS5735056.1 hypothetical protein [Herbiconiux daphne]
MSVHLQPAGLQSAGILPEPALSIAPNESTIHLGWPGLDPIDPSLDVMVFDHSGSVTGVGGTDPIGNRFNEAAMALQLVSRWSTTKRSKAAVVHFDQPSIADSGVVPLNGRLGRLMSSLRVPLGAYGTSELSPSLFTAERLAARYADHVRRLTIFSDFALTDADPSAIFNRLAQFPGQVHAVVLRAAPPFDLAADNISITRISHDDPPGALAAALHRSLTATRRGRRLSPQHESRTYPSIPPLSPGNPA